MTTRNSINADIARFLVITTFLAALAGCMVDESGYRGRTARHTQSTVVYQDDFDYYPYYEVYYSRTRREYVYRDGNAWVRRPIPHHVSPDVLIATPSVRVDFHDSPEHHHNEVIRHYPRNWRRPDRDHDRRRDRDDDDRDARRR